MIVTSVFTIIVNKITSRTLAAESQEFNFNNRTCIRTKKKKKKKKKKEKKEKEINHQDGILTPNAFLHEGHDP